MPVKKSFYKKRYLVKLNVWPKTSGLRTVDLHSLYEKNRLVSPSGSLIVDVEINVSQYRESFVDLIAFLLREITQRAGTQSLINPP
jgi:hypothetical protein